MQRRRTERAALAVMTPATAGTIAFGAKPALIAAHDPAFISRKIGCRAVFALRIRRDAARQTYECEKAFVHNNFFNAKALAPTATATLVPRRDMPTPMRCSGS